MQLESLVDSLQDNDNGGSTRLDRDADSAYTSLMEVPGLPGWFSKRSVLALLWEGTRNGISGVTPGKLPRLMKIVESARLASTDLTIAAQQSGDVVTIGVNVAIAFNSGTKESPVAALFFGRVVKMVTKGSSGKRKPWMTPISLKDVDAGIEIGCEFFTPEPGSDVNYRLGSLAGGDNDRKLYELRSVLGLAYFDYDRGTSVFKLADGQIDKFKTMAEALVTAGLKTAGPDSASGSTKRTRVPATVSQHGDYAKTYTAGGRDRASRRGQTNGESPAAAAPTSVTAAAATATTATASGAAGRKRKRRSVSKK